MTDLRTQRKFRKPGRVYFRLGSAPHRVQLYRDFLGYLESPGHKENGKAIFDLEKPVWTIFITGARIREWGFYCPKGWRLWTDFTNNSGNESRVGKGCE